MNGDASCTTVEFTSSTKSAKLNGIAEPVFVDKGKVTTDNN